MLIDRLDRTNVEPSFLVKRNRSDMDMQQEFSALRGLNVPNVTVEEVSAFQCFFFLAKYTYKHRLCSTLRSCS